MVLFMPLRSEMCVGILFNCRNTLKAVEPQRNDETDISVMVTKVEKINCMMYGASLSTKAMGNRQPSPEQGKAQRLDREVVVSQAIGDSTW